jgi:hypothetical protein
MVKVTAKKTSSSGSSPKYFGSPPKSPFTLPGTYITPTGKVSAGSTAMRRVRTTVGGGGSPPPAEAPPPAQKPIEEARKEPPPVTPIPQQEKPRPVTTIPFLWTPRGVWEYEQTRARAGALVSERERAFLREAEREKRRFREEPELFFGAPGFRKKEVEGGYQYTLEPEYFETLPSYKGYRELFTTPLVEAELGKEIGVKPSKFGIEKKPQLKEEYFKKSLLETKQQFRELPTKERVKMATGETAVAFAKLGVGVGEFGATVFKGMGVQTFEPGKPKQFEFVKFGGRLGEVRELPTVQPSYDWRREPGKWAKEVITERPAVSFPVATITTAGIYGAKGFIGATKTYGLKATTLETAHQLSPLRVSSSAWAYPITEHTKIDARIISGKMGDITKMQIIGKGTTEPVIIRGQQTLRTLGEGKYALGKGTTEITVPTARYFGGELYEGIGMTKFQTFPISKTGYSGVYQAPFGADQITIPGLGGARGRIITQKQFDATVFESPKGWGAQARIYSSGDIFVGKQIGVTADITKNIKGFMAGKEQATITRIDKEGVGRFIRATPTIKGYEYKIFEMKGIGGEPIKYLRPADITKTPFSKTFAVTKEQAITTQLGAVQTSLKGARMFPTSGRLFPPIGVTRIKTKMFMPPVQEETVRGIRLSFAPTTGIILSGRQRYGGLRTVQLQTQSLFQPQRQRQRLRTVQLQKQIQKQIAPSRGIVSGLGFAGQTGEFFVPPPPIFPRLRGAIGGRRKGLFGRTRQPQAYMPSLTGVTLGIKGMEKPIFGRFKLGFLPGIRGIKRKKRKKKKY